MERWDAWTLGGQIGQIDIVVAEEFANIGHRAHILDHLLEAALIGVNCQLLGKGKRDPRADRDRFCGHG
jgi:hypothetical protein